MPFRYERDDAGQQIVVTYHGSFDKEDISGVLERIHREDVLSYRLLYDLRDMHGHPTLAELRSLMKQRANIAAHASPGPIAVVTNDPAMYAMICTYGVLGRPDVKVEGFRDIVEAKAWLSAQLKAR